MLKKLISEAVSQCMPIDKNEIYNCINLVEDSSFGDYALPCFTFAKTLHKSPVQIAQDIKNNIQLPNQFEKCEVVNGYLNFFANKTEFFKNVVNDIFEQKEKYGSSQFGKGKTCLIEHTSINPNASPHIGRARNAIIGDFIARLMKFEGYDVNVHYFVNDIGKQISMLVLGSEDVDEVKFQNLLSMYVQINEKVKENPELEKRVFDLLFKLENGDKETAKKFRHIVDVCIEGQTNIFNKFGITYDCFDYESKYLFDNSMKEILKKLESIGLTFEDELGRIVVNLDKYNLSPLVVTRADKTSLYPLRDIAYTLYKSRTKSDKNIIILGEDQKLYFEQISAIIKELGEIPPEVVHYSFVLLTDGKMSTRNGTVVLLEDFMSETVEKVKERMTENSKTVNEKDQKAIAYGAIKYSIEKSSNEKNVIFDWDTALKFEGNTGPYIQYSLVRINSILDKVDFDKTKVDFEVLKEDNHWEIIKTLNNLSANISATVKDKSPHILCTYISTLAKKLNNFYASGNILKEPNQTIKNTKIALLMATKQVFENVMLILGIDTVEAM